jgi:hypothetical protein
MQLSASLLVPAGTTYANAVTATVPMQVGMLTHCSIVFPAGCARQVNVLIYDGVHPVFPGVINAWYSEDDRTVEINDLRIIEVPTNLIIFAWAPYTSYDHVINVTFESLTAEEVAMKRLGYY